MKSGRFNLSVQLAICHFVLSNKIDGNVLFGQGEEQYRPLISRKTKNARLDVCSRGMKVQQHQKPIPKMFAMFKNC